MLKAYQTEIDNLTRRGKLSETSFLNVYKLLSDAPDPYPLLDAAVDQTVKVAEARMLESELDRLRDENQELKRKVAEGEELEEKLRKSEKRADGLEEKVCGGVLAQTSTSAELTARWTSSSRSACSQSRMN